MLDYQNVTQHGQGWDLDSGETLHTGHLLRFQIHHDTHYAKQSTATVAVWNPNTLTWNPVASFLPAMWATHTALHTLQGTDRIAGTEGTWEAYRELLARADEILSWTDDRG
jgi:hypothetical protein